MSFEFKITETRTYLNGTQEEDEPFICEDERSVFTAPTFQEAENKLKEFIKSFKSEAIIGEVFEDGGGNYEIRIDIDHVCIACELYSDSEWTKTNRKAMDKLEGFKS